MMTACVIVGGSVGHARLETFTIWPLTIPDAPSIFLGMETTTQEQTVTATENPTFQELRDGQQYRNTAGQIVRVHGPIMPGQPIFTTIVETGESYYCSTGSLWKIA